MYTLLFSLFLIPHSLEIQNQKCFHQYKVLDIDRTEEENPMLRSWLPLGEILIGGCGVLLLQWLLLELHIYKIHIK